MTEKTLLKWHPLALAVSANLQYLRPVLIGGIAALGLSGQTNAFTLNPATVFINEIHYDNTGTDAGEFIEIAGPAGTSLSGWQIVRYNGNVPASGVQYTTPAESTALPATIPGTAGTIGVVTVTYPANGLQNGGNDGFALVNNGTVVQFLSYEGVMTAVDGPAIGLTSTDIGVAELGVETLGLSLQLTGSGKVYGDFTWTAPAANTAGAVNTGQTFTGSAVSAGVTVSQSGGATDVTEGGATDTYTVVLNSQPTADVTITLNSGTQLNVSPATLTFTAANWNVAQTVTVTAVDDADVEGAHSGAIGHTASSADTNYNAITVASVTANITDNDAIPVACSNPDTAIGAIQGSGATAALTGTQTVQGVVVGDFEYPGTGTTGDHLRGFYVQDAGDTSDDKSDAIFVFNGNNNSVSLGEVVQVTGTVAEFQNQTQFNSGATIEKCGTTGTVSPVTVSLPVPAAVGGVDFLERYEGMMVTLPQALTVTEHFQLGRFGQVLLSGNGKLPQPTNIVAPGAAANAQQASNNLNKILLDDELQSQNPDPIKFARGGNPLSASNTLRGGDTVTGLTGVLTYNWAGNSASPNAWRVRPINALNATFPVFQAVNLRPTVPAQVNGRLKVASANLLNYFNTFDGLPDTGDNCSNGAGGTAADCRGADDAAEFQRQADKTVKNLAGTGAAVIMVNEIENDGYGANSAIQDLVNRLNAEVGAGTYTFINPDTSNGVNSLGTDAIKVGMIYKPAEVTPVGTTAALNTGAFGLFNTGTSGLIGRSRPALAQAFEENATGARFISVANHLKSKGSSCDDNISPVGPDVDAGDGQGNCNLTRKAAAEQLVTWLLTDPTGTNDSDILIAGDLNSYAKEDPITAIQNAGYVNLIESHLGVSGYSYVFDGQWGYLDHALASPSLAAQVADVLEWHINADEPSVLDYNTNFKTANLITSLYAPDAFRTSDHDPILIGLNLEVPVNTITGTKGADTLVGTSGQDVLIGLKGGDTLTGGAGSDQFVYNLMSDRTDKVTDFTPGTDKIVLTGLLQSLGIVSANPIATGHVVCARWYQTNSVISIDKDGTAGPAKKLSLVVIRNVSCNVLKNAANFMF